MCESNVFLTTDTLACKSITHVQELSVPCSDKFLADKITLYR